MRFGEKLRRLRLSRGLTQEALARSLCVTSRTLINYEQGRCLPKQADVPARVSALFGVSVESLLNDSEDCPGLPPDGQEARRLIAGALFSESRLSQEARDDLVRAMGEPYRGSRRSPARKKRT